MYVIKYRGEERAAWCRPHGAGGLGGGGTDENSGIARLCSEMRLFKRTYSLFDQLLALVRPVRAVVKRVDAAQFHDCQRVSIPGIQGSSGYAGP